MTSAELNGLRDALATSRAEDVFGELNEDLSEEEVNSYQGIVFDYSAGFDAGVSAMQLQIHELKEANANCISLTLHEARMRNVERELEAQSNTVNTYNKINDRLKQKLEIAVKALEFYATRENWLFLDFESDCKEIIRSVDLGCKSMNEDADFAIPSGGRQAREALATIKELS